MSVWVFCFLYSECPLFEVHCSSFLLERATSTHTYVILNIHFQKTIKITHIMQYHDCIVHL